MPALFAHMGAGACSSSQGLRLKTYLRAVLLKCSRISEVIEEIEASGLANAGTGSYLTYEGEIENEACAMSSSGAFSAACLVPPGLFPSKIALAHLEQSVQKGHVKPMAVVYRENQYRDLPFRPDFVISNRETEIVGNAVLEPGLGSDTVGGVEIGETGALCVSSSGGPKNKVPGRIGPCSVYAANTFTSGRVSVSVSGTGEALIRSGICRRIAKRVEKRDIEGIKHELRRFARKEKEFPYMGGIAIYRKEKNGSLIAINFQTAPCFVYGYRTEKKTAAVFKQQKDGEILVEARVLL